MKEWYQIALTDLKAALRDSSKVNGLDFLEDFVFEYRLKYFENLELDDIDDFVSDEFDLFQSWLKDTQNQFVNIRKNGKWYSNNVTNNAINNDSVKLEGSFSLSENDKKLMSLDALGLNSEKVKDFRELYQKLASTNYHELKFKCAIRLAKCAELSREVNENELIEYWLNACDAATRADMPIEASESKSKAAYRYARVFNHGDAAKTYEEAFNIIEDKSSKTKIQLLKSSRIQYQLFGDHESAARVFTKEKELEFSQASFSKKVALKLFYISSNYGESPKKVLWNCFWVILVATVLSFTMGIAVIEGESNYSISSLMNNAYFTIVTFTTLGYGDFSPNTHTGQLFSGCLAMLGLIYSSLFMVTVVRKYART